MRKYRGKHPQRIRQVYSKDLDGLRLHIIQINSGERYILNPAALRHKLPAPGQEIDLSRHEKIGE